MNERVHFAVALGAIVAIAFGYARLAERRGHSLPEGQPAPALALPQLDGGELSLESLRGRTVVLNFWATWCPPCIAEMPALERMQSALAGDGVQVVTVAQDEDREALRQFVASSRLALPILLDPGGVVAAREFKTTGVPETFIIDGNGVVRGQVVGAADWDAPEMLARLRSITAQPKR